MTQCAKVSATTCCPGFIALSWASFTALQNSNPFNSQFGLAAEETRVEVPPSCSVGPLPDITLALG